MRRILLLLVLAITACGLAWWRFGGPQMAELSADEADRRGVVPQPGALVVRGWGAFQDGDVVLAVDGEKVSDAAAFTTARGRALGRSARVSLIRNGTVVMVRTTLSWP